MSGVLLVEEDVLAARRVGNAETDTSLAKAAKQSPKVEGLVST